MSNRDLAKNLIDQIPESKLLYIIAYLQGAAVPDEIPNTETLEAMEEVNGMIESSQGEAFAGDTGDFLRMIAGA